MAAKVSKEKKNCSYDFTHRDHRDKIAELIIYAPNKKTIKDGNNYILGGMFKYKRQDGIFQGRLVFNNKALHLKPPAKPWLPIENWVHEITHFLLRFPCDIHPKNQHGKKFRRIEAFLKKELAK